MAEKKEVTVTEEAKVQPAEEEKGVITLEKAVPVVIKKASYHEGVCRGLHESCKAIDRGVALMCFLAKNCDEPNYPNLITALCNMRNVKLIPVEDQKELGKWAGLCKMDKKGEARKCVRTSVVVITNFGERTPQLDWLQNDANLKDEKAQQAPLQFKAYMNFSYQKLSLIHI
eukprot:TRINITY_DN11114_c0_g1_i1.p1 TRINITY_DN11114_c0_g1~~TRINITY_DN11114_c0_g1_i1.p1  ORF type:complete len:172 (-),score=44.60 TRINITY_DN11114_c0_g1_i1:63-578(-)